MRESQMQIDRASHRPNHVIVRIAIAGFMCCLMCWCDRVAAQASPDPEIGYIFPPGGKAGTTVEVRLGGVNWTPDMQFFVLDRRLGLQPGGSLGPLQLPEAPYLIGPKAYFPPPLARELSARVTIPAEMPAGPVRWQVANANGSSQTGIFVVGDGLEIVEQEDRSEPQPLEGLPVTISGRLRRNEEVDSYRFRASKTGPITSTLAARALGSQFNGVVEVHDSQGRLLADELDSQGKDVRLTFAARETEEYTLAVRDLDFRGHRSFVYRLSIDEAPAVVAAIPAAGRRGETRDVEFVGFGVKTGAAVLESVSRSVTFPPDQSDAVFNYRLETPFGTAAPFRLLLSDIAEAIEGPRSRNAPLELQPPAAVTGTFEGGNVPERYRFAAKKGEVWQVDVQSARLGSTLDLALTIGDASGKELAANDDLPGTTDPSLSFTAPDDGVFDVSLTDNSSTRGTQAAVYRLAVHRPPADFQLEVPQRLSVPLGEKAELAIKLMRTGGFNQPVAVSIDGLPEGVTCPAALVVPADANELKVALQAAVDAPSGASLVKVVGTARLGEREVARDARAQAAGNLVVRRGDENLVGEMLVAATMKPRTRIWPVESDERTVHRGSTHPAAIGIERYEGFGGDVGMQMDSRQPHKFRQGLIGPDIILPAGRDRILYPVFVPQVAETLDAYRLSLVAVAKVPDPRGNVRHLLSRMQDQVSVGITVEGSLLKLSGPVDAIGARPGDVIKVPLTVSRSPKLASSVRLELVDVSPDLEPLVIGEAIEFAHGEDATTFRIDTAADSALGGVRRFTIRAAALEPGEVPALDDTAGASPMNMAMLGLLKTGSLPVIAETTVVVDFH